MEPDLRLRSLGWLALAPLLGACFAAEPPSSLSTPLEASCTQVGAALVEHGCFHAEHGPFASVLASATQSFPGTSPNISTAHTQYTVELPGAPGDNEGTVKYRPLRSGAWAFLVAPDVSLQILDPSDQEVPIELRHDIAPATCGLFTEVHVATLAAGTTYRVVFGPSPHQQIGVVLEKLSDFDAFYFADADGDGFGNPEDTFITACEPPPGYVADDGDCDDTRATVYPGAPEVCDGLDNDCDGEVDEGAAETIFYRDADGDGYGDPAATLEACAAPPGYVTVGGDCDDTRAEVHPGAPEICDGLDNDCNGLIDDLRDELDEAVAHGCAHATLGPFVGVSAAPLDGSDPPDVSAAHAAFQIALVEDDAGWSGEVTLRRPQTGEYALLVDPSVDVAVIDPDGDPVDPEMDREIASCPALARALVVDLEGGVTYRLRFGASAAPEVLLVVEPLEHEHGDDDLETGASTFYRDSDGDGYGDPLVSVQACAAPPGYVDNGADCDDTDPFVHPGAPETCNGIDDDCDGEVDEGAVCECSPLTLEASRSYSPARWDDGVASLQPPRVLAIPTELPVVAGSARKGAATLQLQDAATGRVVRCKYRDAAADRYRLQRCTAGFRGGDAIEAGWLRLRVDRGLASAGPTTVRVDLAVLDCP
jgi:hypothetical protein